MGRQMSRTRFAMAGAGAVTMMLGGCGSGPGDSQMFIAGLQSPQLETEQIVLTEPGFNNSDPLGYVLFVVGPQARAHQAETSILVEAEQSASPRDGLAAR